MKARGKLQGTLNIVRFNWPFYLAASIILIGSEVGFLTLHRLSLKIIFGTAFGASTYFVFGSLGVSHVIYDRSGLYRWEWLERSLAGVKVPQAVFCHCGFDEASAGLRERLAESVWRVLDHFNPNLMTEASIRRARLALPPPPGTVPSPYDAWPLAADSADVIFALLAIHELRSEAERVAWFAESARCLREEGRVLLVEHVRDTANFLAFGPGFLHFHSVASWRRCWEGGGLRAIDQFRVTPFVRVFVLSKA